jgi:uncharacterized protein (DUF697 family)
VGKTPTVRKTEGRTAMPAAIDDTGAEPAAAASGGPDLASKADSLIKEHMLAACAVSIVPVPVLDMAAIAGVQMNMVRKLAALYGKSFSESPVRSAIVGLAGGMFGESAALIAGASFAKLVPGVGSMLGMVTMPVVVGATTYAVGRVFLRHFEQGGSVDDMSTAKMRGYYKQQFAKGKEVAAAATPSTKGA